MNGKKWAALAALILCLAAALPAAAANRFVFTLKTLTISEGESVPTALEREGAYDGEGEIVYASTKPSVATVDAEGCVTAVARGQATVTASLMRGGKRVGQARLAVQVIRPVAKVTLSLRNLNVYDPDDPEIASLLKEPTEYRVIALPEGGTAPLAAACTPEDASSKRVAFATSDAGVARVANGKTLKGVQRGECDLTVSSVSNPEVTETFRVLVTKPVRTVGIVSETRSVPVGSALSLSAVFSPDDASIKKVTWTSKNPAVAAVDAGGTVTGIKKGTAVITAASADGSKAAGTLTVTVTQPVTEIRLKQAEVSLNVGKSQAVSATVLPAGASDRALAWSSSDDTVATVANGKITGKKAGSCFVTCASRSDPDVTADVAVTVRQPVTKAEIVNAKGELTLRAGGEVQLEWVLSPEDVTDRSVTFRSSNPKVASVDADGLVRGVSRGTATVYVIARDGSKRQGGAKVTVTQPVTGVRMARPLYYVQLGGSGGVRAVVEPRNANNRKVYWSAEDEGVCTVTSAGESAGRLWGVAPGTTTVSAFTEDGGYTAEARVRVGLFNEAVLIEDLYVDEYTGRIMISLRNMSADLTLECVYFRVECFTEYGAPMICSRDGTGCSFEGTYAWELPPLERTAPGGFRFGNGAVEELPGAVLLTVTGWKDAEGIAWTIPEDERITRQWTALFPVG